MKKRIWLIVGVLCSGYTSAHAQATFQLENAFDFWVGQWKVSWYTQDSTLVEGINTIEKILDGKVIQEHFVDTMNNFKGTSISVYNPRDSTWHQAWADNAGGYYDFYGAFEGEKRIFKTEPKILQGNHVVLRMVFYDIEENSLTWDWESSADGGETWNLQWRIYYERIQSIN